MNFKFVLFVIFGLFVRELLSTIPKLKSHHAIIGDYISLNMQTCGLVSPKDQPIIESTSRVIGGEVAELGEFPWHVFMYKKMRNGKFRPSCGGVLIHKLFVITDRHCVESALKKAEVKEEDLLLSFGSVKKGELNITRNVSLIIRHPYNDLALLELNTELNPLLSRDGSFYVINYICLPNENASNVNPEETIIAGSGEDWIIPHNYTGPISYNEFLRKAIIRIDSVDECKRRGFPIYYICAAVYVNMTCFGDSGSGLVQFADDNRAILIGTTLGGQVFNKGDPACSPGVLEFLRMSYFINFFLDVIEYNNTLAYITKQSTLSDATEVPVLNRGHARIGNYPFMDMQNCGYMNPNHVVKNKIIGGTPAVLGEFPWQVAIHYKKASHLASRDTFICGGALINEDWVLTNKHCLQSTDLSSDLKVYLGSLNRYDFHNIHFVSDIVRHPQFDLMLLKLRTPSFPVQMANYYVINTICLPKLRIINNLSEEAFLSGWGYTDSAAKNRSLTLQRTTLLIKPYSECLVIPNNEKPLIFEQMCAIESQHMFYMCDSGTPLVQFVGKRAVIIGTVQSHTTYTTELCGPGVYVLMRVSFFVDWIAHNIESQDYQPALVNDNLDTSTQGALSNCRPQLILTLICFYAKFYFY